MVFKKAIGSYILAQTLTMCWDKIQSWCCGFPFLTAALFFDLNNGIKKILIPNLPLPIVFSLFFLFSPFLSNLSGCPFSKFQGRSLNEQLPQQAWPMFTGQPTNRGTLVQDSCLLFGDKTNLCDKFQVHSLKLKSQALSFQIFPVGNPSYWAHSLQISI